MTSLDTLTMTGSELTTEQLDAVDGGMVIAALVVANIFIWGANAVVWSLSD